MLGKLVRLLQLSQARANVVALLVLIAGELVRLEQLCHAPWLVSPKLVTLAVLIAGKLVSPVQPAHAPANDMAELKSSKGKLVSPLQLRQVPEPLLGLPK